jgi:hypothetical protein
LKGNLRQNPALKKEMVEFLKQLENPKVDNVDRLDNQRIIDTAAERGFNGFRYADKFGVFENTKKDELDEAGHESPNANASDSEEVHDNELQ